MSPLLFVYLWRTIDSNATNGAQRIALFSPFMRGSVRGSSSYLPQVLMFTSGGMGVLAGIVVRRTMPAQCTSHGPPERLGLNIGGPYSNDSPSSLITHLEGILA